MSLQHDGTLLVEDGNHGEYRPRRHEFEDDGVHFIRAADMSGGRVLFQSAARINHEARDRVRKGIGSPGDVLLSHKGTVGKVAMVPEDAPPFICSPQTTFYRSQNTSRLDRRYLFYFLQSPEFGAQLRSRKAETDMADYVSLSAQRQLLIRLPPIDEQRRIAGVLGALDDLIETNERLAGCARRVMMSNFERMARDATSVVSFGEIAELCGDTVRPRDLGAATPYVGLEHFSPDGGGLTGMGTASDTESGKRTFESGDILYGKLRPYFRKVDRPHFAGVCSTEIWVLRPSGGVATPEYLYYVIATESFTDWAMRGSEGTRMPRASWNHVSQMPVALPEPDQLAEGSTFAREMWEAAGQLSAETGVLRRARDELLPLLMSGAVSPGEMSQPS